MQAISPELTTIDRADTLTDMTYERLRRALIAGAFSPGEKITIRGIAKIFGVSPTPARDALGRLVAERALEMGQNRTVVVPSLNSTKLTEVYRLRLAIEGLAVEVAAERFDKGGIKELEQIQSELNAALDAKDYKATLEANEKFHFALYGAADMPLASSMIEGLWVQIGPYLNLLYPEFDRTRKGVSAHTAVIRALKKKDGKAARKAIEQDLEHGRDLLMRHFQAEEES